MPCSASGFPRPRAWGGARAWVLLLLIPISFPHSALSLCLDSTTRVGHYCLDCASGESSFGV